GGSLALLIRAVAGTSVNYTVLQVEPDLEGPQAEAFIRVHAPNGRTIARNREGRDGVRPLAKGFGELRKRCGEGPTPRPYRAMRLTGLPVQPFLPSHSGSSIRQAPPMRSSAAKLAATALLLACAGTASALAEPVPAPNNANCQNTGSFERWLAAFRQEAAAQGISRATLSAALDGMTLDPGIIARDRRQSFFSQSFAAFAPKLISQNRLQTGAAKLKQHRELFARVERDYGVPGPVIVAFWGLESDFGGGMGNLPVLRSLATLAYDCRRPEMFRGELMDALRIIDRGDLTPGEMIGSWAGELGQTQFLPSHYFKYAVDYDGDGRRNLLRSVPDVMASTANLIVFLGWKRGEPWLQEVRVPANLAWDQ